MKLARQISTKIKPLSAALLLLAMAACAPTRVQPLETYSGSTLARPAIVLVSDFAVTPEDVKLDRGLSARLKAMFNSEPTSEQQLATGRRVAEAVSKTLVAEIEKLGLPVTRGAAAASTSGDPTLIVTGQLLSVDEGNRTRRNLIGLGAGRSEVEADTQLYYRNGTTAPQLVESYNVNAQSGRKPGAAETMGVGAASGRAAEMAATSAGTSVASETFGADVEADGQRMGKEIAKRLAQFFANQGWIPPQPQ